MNIIISSLCVLALILSLAFFIPIKEYEPKYDIYLFDVELINGKRGTLSLKLSDEKEYYIHYHEGSYVLVVNDKEIFENIYGIKISHTNKELYFPGVCFVNSVTKV